jgi:hypothetical protein
MTFLVMVLAVVPVSAQKKTKDAMTMTVPGAPGQPAQFVTIAEPDAQRTKNEFERLLGRYPPTVRGVFRQDPTLMTQQQYLAPYPALASFLSAHPEIALNPAFYLDGLGDDNREPRDHAWQVINMWDNFMRVLAVFAGFAMAIGLLTWLIRTFLDYRRWNRLSRVQTEVHTRLLDRFSTNEELMAYIATPAGSKFLQSAPISLDTGAASKSMGAPLSRIMWSAQAGLVLCAAGGGLMLASGRMSDDSYLPLEIMGILAAALGVGFAVSAAVSFLLSHKMGLLDPVSKKRAFSNPPSDSPEAQ